MGKINVQLPKSWNELTDGQLVSMAGLFATTKPGVHLDAGIFRILMGKRQVDAIRIMEEVPLSQLKPFYSFIYFENNRTAFIKRWKVNRKWYYAPGDRINNLDAEEYAVAEDLHYQWRNKKERIYLELMAAVLYVPQKGLRPVFEKELLQEKAKAFAGEPIEKLLAMEMAFFGCMAHLWSVFPKVFPKSAPTTAMAQRKHGFGKVILGMAGGKFGTHEQTKRTKIYTFLEEFTENLKQIEHAKRNS